MSVAAKRIPGLGEENISISDAVGPGPPILPCVARKVRQDPDAEHAVAERHFSTIDIVGAVADDIAVAMGVAAPVGRGIAAEIAEYGHAQGMEIPRAKEGRPGLFFSIESIAPRWNLFSFQVSN